MLGLKNFLFKGGATAALPDELRAALETWRESAPPVLDSIHFHTRYVIVDIVTSGAKADSEQLLSIAASTVQQSAIRPDDALFIDFSAGEGEGGTPQSDLTAAAVDRKLMAFLQFAAKAPLVTYNVPYVATVLQRTIKERLGIDCQPQWVDLAWLLPAMFPEKSQSVVPLDQWIEAFGLNAGHVRRNAMENTLMLARIFQMLLVRATGKQIDTAAQLIDESSASSFLRRTH